jgi:hypothetical protein
VVWLCILGITGAMGAPNALPLEQSLQNVGIDLACVLFFGFFFKRDADGRGLHSSTFRLNVSAYCGIRGAVRG